MKQSCDMHVHFDISGRDVAAQAQLACVESDVARVCAGCFFNTLTPEQFERLGSRNVWGSFRVGLGMHPWWVADGSCDEASIRLFDDLAQDARYVGEVGLDFSPRILERQLSGKPAEEVRRSQLSAFEHILDAVANNTIELMSVHAVNAAGAVLDLLEEQKLFDKTTVIFHWFSGSSEELMRARNAGCYFSVNECMLATRKGRAYVQSLPADRLLLESDALFTSDDLAGGAYAENLSAQLSRTQQLINEIKGEDISGLIAATSKRLLG